MEEIVLTGGRTTAGVVRIGETVRRPIRARSKLAQQLLRHFEARGFTGAPRFLGIDERGREVLSFVSGVVPSELGHFSDAPLAAAARLLRQLHDASLDCSLRNEDEVVCHGDASPCNCVFIDGEPQAFIDFDEAHPGSRLDDLGYAAWLWIDIGNDELTVDSQGQRVANFFRHYGVSAEDAVPGIVAAQVRLAERTESAGVRAWAERCREWVEQHRARFADAVASARVE